MTVSKRRLLAIALGISLGLGLPVAGLFVSAYFYSKTSQAHPDAAMNYFPQKVSRDPNSQRVTGALPRGTVEDRVRELGADAEASWAPFFKEAQLSYPPKALTLAFFKEEKILEVYAGPDYKQLKCIRRLPVLAASGCLGPKLREGDLQVPEGLYSIELLNPNSRFHLSLRLDYPNRFDRARAEEEQRRQLGGDIMIHGGAASIGCLAMGDEAAQDLFILAALCDRPSIKVLIAPLDLRQRAFPTDTPGLPAWYPTLLKIIRGELANLPLPPERQPTLNQTR